MTDVLYDDAFFEFQQDYSQQSARRVVPRVLDWVPAKSVVDVGCGQGTWLAEFVAAGVTDYLGIDGDYVNRERLQIAPNRFLAHDLERPFRLDRTFDLAVCVEVAEHLRPHCAQNLVASLTALAPAVLFSAAIPGQMGIGHVNEQWPEFWIELFRQRDYVAVDCLRKDLWNNPQISVWYKQNLFFYVDAKRLADYPRFARALEAAGGPPLSLVHPEHYLNLQRQMFTELIENPREMMYNLLGLRAINLLVQPDWTQSDESLSRDVEALLVALADHPQRHATALVFHIHDPSGIEWLDRLTADALARGAIRANDGPALIAIGARFGPKHFALLLDCLAARITLPHDDTGALVTTGSRRLTVLSVADIERKQSLRE